MNCHMSLISPRETAMDQSEHRTRWPRGQRLRPRIERKYIRVLTRLTSVGDAACTFDIVIADHQKMAVAEWMQSFSSVRGPMERPGILCVPYRVSPCSSAHWKRTSGSQEI